MLSKGLRSIVGWWTIGRMGIVIATLGLVVTVLGHLDDNLGALTMPELFRDLWANLGTELFSIALTVLIIDGLSQRRERRQREERDVKRSSEGLKQLKKQLIRQIGSSVNEQAMRAAEELRANGWLEDGSLEWAKLSGANLSHANLRYANLKGTSLFRANLEEASLYHADLTSAKLRAADLRGASLGGANLQGANLGGAKMQGAFLAGVNLARADMLKANLNGVRKLKIGTLAEAHRLAGVTMPDGSHYDGRFKLEGDFHMAERNGIDIEDEDAMREWYASVRRKKSRSSEE